MVSIHAAVAGFRAAEARIMRSTCTIERAAGDATFDPDTGAYTADTTTTVYEGPCLFRPQATQDRVVQVGEAPASLRTYVVKVPYDVEPAVEDVFTLTASEEDAAAVGRPMRVLDVVHDDWNVSRRIVVEDRQD